MSQYRRAAKRDISEPEIVRALQKAGYQVYRKLPVDLLVHRPDMGAGVFRCLEVKTPSRKDGSTAVDKRQGAQADFLADTGTHRVYTPTQALKAVGAI